MQVQVFINSARDLKNVNWRNGLLKPYAVVWIDTSGRCSTKADQDNGVNPKWNEKFTIPLRSTSRPETAILYIDVVHAIASPNTKPLVGSAKLLLNEVLTEARANGKVARCLELLRPSGRPQGIIEIQIRTKDISPGDQHVKQAPQNNQPIPLKVESKPQVQSQPQVQHKAQAQFQPQPQPQYQAQFQPQPQAQVQQVQLQPPQAQVQQFQPQPQLQVQQFHAQPQPQAQVQKFHPQPQAQFRQPRAQFHARPQPLQPRPMAPMPRPRPRPTGPSATQQICNLGIDMAFGGLPVSRLLRLGGNNNNNANVPANNIVYASGQNGYDIGGGYDNGSAPDNGYAIDSSGYDNGYAIDSSGYDNGYGDDCSGYDNGYGDDCSGYDNGYGDDCGSMDGGGFDDGGFEYTG